MLCFVLFNKVQHWKKIFFSLYSSFFFITFFFSNLSSISFHIYFFLKNNMQYLQFAQHLMQSLAEKKNLQKKKRKNSFEFQFGLIQWIIMYVWEWLTCIKKKFFWTKNIVLNPIYMMKPSSFSWIKTKKSGKKLTVDVCNVKFFFFAT